MGGPGRLKISWNNDELWIRGDKEGLKFLADCCTRIIGHRDPGGHILLQWQMNNLIAGSLETRLEFTEDDEDFED
jgi:hypothetical protein